MPEIKYLNKEGLQYLIKKLDKKYLKDQTLPEEYKNETYEINRPIPNIEVDWDLVRTYSADLGFRSWAFNTESIVIADNKKSDWSRVMLIRNAGKYAFLIYNNYGDLNSYLLPEPSFTLVETTFLNTSWVKFSLVLLEYLGTADFEDKDTAEIKTIYNQLEFITEDTDIFRYTENLILNPKIFYKSSFINGDWENLIKFDEFSYSSENYHIEIQLAGDLVLLGINDLAVVSEDYMGVKNNTWINTSNLEETFIPSIDFTQEVFTPAMSEEQISVLKTFFTPAVNKISLEEALQRKLKPGFGISLKNNIINSEVEYQSIDDAATMILGTAYRMPTSVECEELVTNCTWEWITLNGVNGYKVKSTMPGNDNWIFLPASGSRDGTSGGNVGVHGYYWSSNVSERDDLAHFLHFNSNNSSTSLSARYFGLSIRPVSLSKGVDLGLSVKWASSNLTSTGLSELIYDYGDYFAWGETEPKEVYTDDTYKFQLLSKYNYTDGLTTLQNKLYTTNHGDELQVKLEAGEGIKIQNNIISATSSEGEVKCIQLTSSAWNRQTWKNFSPGDAKKFWKDYNNVVHYDSDWSGVNHYYLGSDGMTWYPLTWFGYSAIDGDHVWTDNNGVIHYDDGSNHYYLDSDNQTWIEHTWDGYTSISGRYIWRDNNGVIHWDNGNNYYLDSNDVTWKKLTWNGVFSVIGNYIWTDHNGTIHYDRGSDHYYLNDSTNIWVRQTWEGFSPNEGVLIWKDYDNIVHFDYNSDHYYLDQTDNIWKKLTWSVLENFRGNSIWYDSNNVIHLDDTTYYNLHYYLGGANSYFTRHDDELQAKINNSGDVISIDGTNTLHYAFEHDACGYVSNGPSSVLKINAVTNSTTNDPAPLSWGLGGIYSYLITIFISSTNNGDFDDSPVYMAIVDTYWNAQNILINTLPQWGYENPKYCLDSFNNINSLYITGVAGGAYINVKRLCGDTPKENVVSKLIILPATSDEISRITFPDKNPNNLLSSMDNGLTFRISNSMGTSGDPTSYFKLLILGEKGNHRKKFTNKFISNYFPKNSVPAETTTNDTSYLVVINSDYKDDNYTCIVNICRMGNVLLLNDTTDGRFRISRCNAPSSSPSNFLELFTIYAKETGASTITITPLGNNCTIPIKYYLNPCSLTEIDSNSAVLPITKIGGFSTNTLVREEVVQETIGDDAARAILGGDWRMPTHDEYIELRRNTYMVFRSGGLIVYKAKKESDKGTYIAKNLTASSDYNDSDPHIFFPAASYYSDTDYIGYAGFYWGSSLSSVTDSALFFDFTESQDYFNGWPVNREAGLPIRAVSNTQGIDLGLPSGLRWASSNLTRTGFAEHEYDYGDYFAWGETEPKEVYSWSNYKFGASSNLTKYNSTDNLTTLELPQKIINTKEDLVKTYYDSEGNLTKLVTENEEEILIPKSSNKINPFNWIINADVESKYFSNTQYNNKEIRILHLDRLPVKDTEYITKINLFIREPDWGLLKYSNRFGNYGAMVYYFLLGKIDAGTLISKIDEGTEINIYFGKSNMHNSSIYACKLADKYFTIADSNIAASTMNEDSLGNYTSSDSTNNFDIATSWWCSKISLVYYKGRWYPNMGYGYGY